MREGWTEECDRFGRWWRHTSGALVCDPGYALPRGRYFVVRADASVPGKDDGGAIVLWHSPEEAMQYVEEGVRASEGALRI